MTVGEKVRNAMDVRGVKLNYLAGKMGVTRQTLSNRLNGVSDFTVTEIEDVTEALKLTKEERDDIFFARKVE